MPKNNNSELRFGLEKSFKIVHKVYNHLMNLKENPGSGTYELLNKIKSGDKKAIKKCKEKYDEESDEAKNVLEGKHKHIGNTLRQDMINELQQGIYWLTLAVVGRGIDYNSLEVSRFFDYSFNNKLDDGQLITDIVLEPKEDSPKADLITNFRVGISIAGIYLRKFNNKFGTEHGKIEPEDLAVWDLEQMLERDYLKTYINNKIIEEGKVLKPQFEKRGGKLPAIIQDHNCPWTLYNMFFLDKKGLDQILKERKIYNSNIDKNGILVDCDKDSIVFKIHNSEKTSESSFSSLRAKYKYKIKFEESKNNLVPTMVQDIDSGDILMLAYANKEALDITFKKGLATFYSTSRKELWTKGETSGDYLDIRYIFSNIKNNVLLYVVKMAGKGACHTKNIDNETRKSCFYRELLNDNMSLKFLPDMY